MKRQRDKLDNIFIGIAIGAIVPVLGYLLIDGLFDMAINSGVIPSNGSGTIRRQRTFTLIALCFNLIPFTNFKNKRYDQAMRGVVFPTMIYVIFWLFKYSSSLF